MFEFWRFKVKGHSMEPTLQEGDIVWVFRWAYLFTSPKIGDVVVFKNNDKYFVKRVVGIKNNGFMLEGDNKIDSSDSRKLGLIKKDAIVGKVLNKEERKNKNFYPLTR